MAGAAAYRPLRLEIEGRAFHSTLFARLHTSKADDSDLPAQRTLFAVNVPHGATEAGLQAAFERLGAVSEVRLSSMTAEPASSSAAAATPTVTSTAHVVFETAGAAGSLHSPQRAHRGEPRKRPGARSFFLKDSALGSPRPGSAARRVG